MKAKKTVMGYDKVREICIGSDLSICDAVNVAQAQAEISFKAGIREVVEWLEKYTTYHHLIRRKEWQAKLKEWNI